MIERGLVQVALLAADYDEAIAWFTRALGFHLVEDQPLGPDKRWVVLGPAAATGARLRLAKAQGAAQAALVGAQFGGRVGFFLRTDDFDRDHARFAQAGVRFEEPPRDEPFGRVAVFLDLYGNRWELMGPPPHAITPHGH